jgi:hypothetical protein
VEDRGDQAGDPASFLLVPSGGFNEDVIEHGGLSLRQFDTVVPRKRTA